MGDAFSEEEKAYWAKEARQRTSDVEASRARGDAAHLLAAAELRLREATERLGAISTPPCDVANASNRPEQVFR